MNIADCYAFEKCPTLITERSVKHVRIKEKNFFLGRQHDVAEAKPSKVKPTKSAITEFSIKSQRNCKFKFDSASRGMTSAICLTYPLEMRDELDGRRIKKHFKAFILAYLRKFGLDGRYFWVLEFQKNGNPHFHIVTDCKADIKTQREFVAARWYKIVGSGLPKALKAGTSCELVRSQAGVASYIAGYLKKGHQKQVPENFHNVGRFWGGSKNAFEIETQVHHFEGSMNGIAAARRALRLFRRYKSSKLRELSKKTGIKYQLPKPGGGFVCWSGRAAFDQLMEWQSNQAGVPF